MPAITVYETEIAQELGRRNYKPAVIHHVPTPPEVHHHPPPVEPPIHYQPPQMTAREKAMAMVGLALALLGLTAFDEEE